MSTHLKSILDKEFSQLSAGDEIRFSTLSKRAEFLGVTESWLSRLCNGKADLSTDLAIRFAEKLRTSPEKRQALLSDFLEAHQLIDASPLVFDADGALTNSEPGDVRHIPSFFRRLGDAQAFLAVEYRDIPRTHPAGAFRRYGNDAAYALVAGLHFAMFQPFGIPDCYDGQLPDIHHSSKVRHFIYDLIEKVRRTYRLILADALDFAETEGKQHEFESITHRMVLYERDARHSDFPLNFLSGIQSRIFYAEIPEQKSPSNQRASKEVWEWVAGKSRDFFIQRNDERHSNDPYVEAVGEQFYPVLRFWRENGKSLPGTTEELNRCISDGNTEIRAQLPEGVWKPYINPMDALDRWRKNTLRPR